MHAVTGMNDIVQAHIDWMAEQSYSSKTIADRRRVLVHADAHLPRGIDDVYPVEIRTYVRKRDWSVWTAHTYHCHLSRFYRQAFEAGLMSADPMAGMKPPPCGRCRPKPVSPAELHQALDRSDDPFHTAIMLAVGAGLRASEIADIRRQDVTEEYVHVRRGKGGKERYVDTCTVLWDYLKDRPLGPLLRRCYGCPVTGHWLSSVQHAHFAAIGLPQLHWHRFRHTFCTVMLQAGNDALVLRDLMGHESVVTTQGYAETAASQRRLALTAVDHLLARTPQPVSARLGRATEAA